MNNQLQQMINLLKDYLNDCGVNELDLYANSTEIEYRKANLQEFNFDNLLNSFNGFSQNQILEFIEDGIKNNDNYSIIDEIDYFYIDSCNNIIFLNSDDFSDICKNIILDDLDCFDTTLTPNELRDNIYYLFRKSNKLLDDDASFLLHQLDVILNLKEKIA